MKCDVCIRKELYAMRVPGRTRFHCWRQAPAKSHLPCDVEIRKDLCASVVLSGNTTIFQGIDEGVTLAPNCTIDLASSDGLAGMKVDNDRLGQLRVSALAVHTLIEGTSLGSQVHLSSFVA